MNHCTSRLHAALRSLSASAAAILLVFAHGNAEAKNIVETAAESGQFTTLLAAAEAAGLADALSGEGPLTVFAPTDEAFAKLPEGAVEALLEDTPKLQTILLHHVVAGKVTASDAAGLDSAESLIGQPLAIAAGDGVTVGGAKVIAADIEASNGVIHVIDSVILPLNLAEVAAAAGQFGTLLAAVDAAGLGELLATGGPFTVFAPTDEAFAKLPEGTVETLLQPENQSSLAEILAYHVVPGIVKAEDAAKLEKAPTAQGGELSISAEKSDEGLKLEVDGAKVIAADIVALNGVIHVIDAVVLPQ